MPWNLSKWVDEQVFRYDEWRGKDADRFGEVILMLLASGLFAVGGFGVH